MSETVLTALLLAHMVADYPLQSNHMAECKHTDRDALTAHALVHAWVAFVSMSLFDVGAYGAIAFAVILGAMHWYIDHSNLHIRWDQTAHLASIVLLAGIAFGLHAV